MYIDWTYIVLVLPAVFFSLWASTKVNSTFQTYSRQQTYSGITGREAAQMILDANGLNQVRIEKTQGSLTDHYDPKSNVIRLSESVYDVATTAAVGVAAHECGHAIQHAVGYFPIRVRAAIIPITNIGSKLSIPLILIGILFASVSSFFVSVAYIGVACFSLCVLFQLVTLPTEFNASSRAIAALENSGRMRTDEIHGAKQVLRAAALTYVAALAVSFAQLIRFLLIIGGNRRRN